MTGLFYKSQKYGQATAVLCVFFKFRRGENVKGRLNCYQATSFRFRCFICYLICYFSILKNILFLNHDVFI